MGRDIEFDAVRNVRDLGGIVGAGGRAVRAGLLFRGGQLAGATEGDRSKLVQLGVRKVVDFRSVAEHEQHPDPDIPGIANLHLPIIQDVRAGITHGEAENASISRMLAGSGAGPEMVDAYMQAMYRQFVNDPFANAQYARFVDEVIASAQAGEGVLWHCTAGKDRAGFGTVVVLSALGVARADIVEDYLLTNERLAGFTDSLLVRFADRLPSEAAQVAVRRFFAADEGFLSAAYAEAESLFGSFDAFLSRALGVEAAKRELMQELLLA